MPGRLSDFLLLDEPFAGSTRSRSSKSRNRTPAGGQSGIGVLVTDHKRPGDLSIVDGAYIINAGEILRAGTPLALSSDAVVKKIYLGEAFSAELKRMIVKKRHQEPAGRATRAGRN
jgi:lipopolysaccharide export system ATP-binding protein